MSAGRFLSNLLLVPRCRGCGVRFDIFMQPDPLPLCPACLARWEQAKQVRCPLCADAISSCTCMPPLLREVGCGALVKAVAYRPDDKQLPERIILRCKRLRDRDTFRFLASDVQLPLWRAMEQQGGMENAVITYVPRRYAAVAREGVDQGCELARAVGKALELPVRKTLQNRGKEAQKTLDHTQRWAQAQRAIVARTDAAAAVSGKTVVIVDDIATVGATLAAATQILLAAGAKSVVCCVVGVTADGSGRG